MGDQFIMTETLEKIIDRPKQTELSSLTEQEEALLETTKSFPGRQQRLAKIKVDTQRLVRMGFKDLNILECCSLLAGCPSKKFRLVRNMSSYNHFSRGLFPGSSTFRLGELEDLLYLAPTRALEATLEFRHLFRSVKVLAPRKAFYNVRLDPLILGTIGDVYNYSEAFNSDDPDYYWNSRKRSGGIDYWSPWRRSDIEQKIFFPIAQW